MATERLEPPIRKATPDDAYACAELLLMASHGMAEAVDRNLVAGQSTVQIIAERRIQPQGRLTSYTNWWVAEDGKQNTAGAINIYPHRENTPRASEVLLTEERINVFAPMIELDALAVGTYYINFVAVFPEYRHRGIASALIALALDEARRAGMSAIGLTTFEADTRLINYYQGFGFAITASRQIVPHECLLATGNMVLMKRPL